MWQSESKRNKGVSRGINGRTQREQRETKCLQSGFTRNAKWWHKETKRFMVEKIREHSEMEIMQRETVKKVKWCVKEGEKRW